MNARAGAWWSFMRNQVVIGQQRRDDGVTRLGRGGHRGDPRLRRRGEVVGRGGAELGGQLRAAGRCQLVGVQPRLQPERRGGLEDAPRLVGGEDAGLAEDVGEARPAVGGDPGELLVDERADERLGAVRSRAELRRDGVGAEPGRHDVHRALAAEAVGDVEQPELRLEVQAVARLRLDGGDPVAEHLVEPAPAVGEQLALRGGPGRGDRRQDPATFGQDVEVRRRRAGA